jgi:hypothetical protein
MQKTFKIEIYYVFKLNKKTLNFCLNLNLINNIKNLRILAKDKQIFFLQEKKYFRYNKFFKYFFLTNVLFRELIPSKKGKNLCEPY